MIEMKEASGSAKVQKSRWPYLPSPFKIDSPVKAAGLHS
jgi:hypothetical protein